MRYEIIGKYEKELLGLKLSGVLVSEIDWSLYKVKVSLIQF